MKADLYQQVTDKIVAALERGTAPWQKPWNGGGLNAAIRPLRHTGEPYKGINVLLLWSAADAGGFKARHWFTYKQAVEYGAHVRKGEKGTAVVFVGAITKTEETAEGEEETRIPFLKQYTVFNGDQIEGLPDRFQVKPDAPGETIDTPERIAHAEAFFAATGATVRHGGDRAFYTPTHDYVQMPHLESFRDNVAYYSTLAHEIAHWTKHESRLNREFGRKRWGDHGYATEELVAEIGAAFLCASLGLSSEPREDHAAYIASWLQVLKNDKRAIFTAASHAQRAADYLHALQPAAAREEIAA